MDSLLKSCQTNLQLLLSMTAFKVPISEDFWYLFRISACTRKSVSMGLHESCLWPGQSLMSCDSDILASVFLTRRAVSREAGLWAQHSIISFPICRRHCGEKRERKSHLGQWKRRLQSAAMMKKWRKKVFPKASQKKRQHAGWYCFSRAFVFCIFKRVLQIRQLLLNFMTSYNLDLAVCSTEALFLFPLPQPRTAWPVPV